MATLPRAGALLLAAVVVAGCSGSPGRWSGRGSSSPPGGAIAQASGSTRPGASPSARASESATAEPDETPTPKSSRTPPASPTPTAEPTPDASLRPLPSGWQRITLLDDGLSVGLPPTWFVLRADRADEIEGVLDEASGTVAGQLLSSSVDKLRSGDYQIEAADRAATLSKFAAFMAIVEPYTDPALRSELSKYVVAELKKQYPQATITSRQLSLPAGPALLLTYTMRDASAGFSMNVKMLQYVVFAPQHSYQLMMMTTTNAYSAYAPTFTKIADSLQTF